MDGIVLMSEKCNWFVQEKSVILLLCINVLVCLGFGKASTLAATLWDNLADIKPTFDTRLLDGHTTRAPEKKRKTF